MSKLEGLPTNFTIPAFFNGDISNILGRCTVTEEHGDIRLDIRFEESKMLELLNGFKNKIPIGLSFSGYSAEPVETASERAKRIVAEAEAKLCECDRPDESDNPHRHDKSEVCVFWAWIKPEIEKLRTDYENLH